MRIDWAKGYPISSNLFNSPFSLREKVAKGRMRGNKSIRELDIPPSP